MQQPFELLYRLLHVSDLHFGDLPSSAVPSELNAPTPRHLRRFPILEGQLGHHARAVEGLHEFHGDLMSQGTPFDLVVSGDLTANGAVSQFALADAFLGLGPSPFGCSLGRPDWVGLSTSGNHDQWPGHNGIRGNPTGGLAATFPGPWPRHENRGLPDGGRVHFIFLDTDAEVHPRGIDRWLGRGSFAQQLIDLENLPRIEEGEVRVLVMHHSIVGMRDTVPHRTEPPPFMHAPLPSGIIKKLEIDLQSTRLLHHLIARHSISVVLTGHIHTPQLSLIATATGAREGRFLEARCGTTTQRDAYPFRDVRNMRTVRHLPPNTLILHELVRREGELWWMAQIYWLDRQGRFVTQVQHTPGVPGGYARSSISII